MKKLALHWKIIIGLVVGVIWAYLAIAFGFRQFTLDWINPFGEIFINLLKLIAVPLVLFSIIKGISGLSDITKLGRVGIKTLGAYLLTTVMAVTLGLVLVNTISPGTFVDDDQRLINREKYERFVAGKEGVELKDEAKVLADSLFVEDAESLEVSPGVGEGTDSEVSEEIAEKMETAQATKEVGPLQFIVDMVPSNIFFSLNDNSLMLQVIFFAIFFGITMIMIPKEKVAPVMHFVDGINEIFLKMVDIVMQAAPFFVFALMAGKMAGLAESTAGLNQMFKGLGSYSLVVVLGLGMMVFLIYPVIVALFVKNVSYSEFFRSISPAQFLAFSTSSSAATLPVTMDCVRENLGVSKEITSFVLPIGATVNMDGTSLYQAVAVVFLAQLFMVDLTLAQQLTIVLTATLASIGSAAVPSAGLVMLIIVLESVGLDPSWIAIIFPVDRILDMCRTVVNVTGDATVSSLIAQSEGELNYVPQEEIKNFEV